MLRNQSAGGDGVRLPESKGRGTLHVAVVRAQDGIRLAVACRTAGALGRRLSRYVLEHAPQQLWPDDAEHVRFLLHRGKREAAVAHYFARVGERWDHEQLVRMRLLAPRP